MVVFRWIVGVLLALFALGAAASFTIFIVYDLQHWLERARRLRRFAWLMVLLWFNVEVWGSVIRTLIHW